MNLQYIAANAIDVNRHPGVIDQPLVPLGFVCQADPPIYVSLECGDNDAGIVWHAKSSVLYSAIQN
jgi:hypothetical protein